MHVYSVMALHRLPTFAEARYVRLEVEVRPKASNSWPRAEHDLHSFCLALGRLLGLQTKSERRLAGLAKNFSNIGLFQ